MSASWYTYDIKLPYWLGEICLFRKTFRMQSTNVDFIEYGDSSSGLTTPDEVDETADGVMLFSTPICEAHKMLWREDGYINYVSQSFHRYYIDLKGNYDDYLQQFSSKTRSTFRRKIRKFEKESGGEIDWRVYINPTEMQEFHKLAREVSKETYQEKLLNAGLPEDEGFLDDMMRHAREGSVRAFLLFLDGKPVSYLYLPVYQNRLLYDYLGYLPEVGRLSAGMVLLLKALEYLFDDDAAPIFDFTEGQSDQKEQFSTDSIYCVNLYRLKDTFTNAFWLRLHQAVTGFSKGLNRFLQAIGLKTFLKKLLRR